MSTSNPLRAIFRFGAFEIDSRTGELRKNECAFDVGAADQVLVALQSAREKLLTREELRQRVWPEDTS